MDDQEKHKALIGSWNISVRTAGKDRHEIMVEFLKDLMKLSKEYNGDFVISTIDTDIEPTDC